MKKMTENRVLAGLLGTALMAGMLSGCAGGTAKEEVSTGSNMDMSQTEFTVLSAMSALSPGYDDNTVLNAMAGEAGVTIDWQTLSDSISEQVNVRIAGGQLPDAFQGVGFSNYDLSAYGDDGTFIDLTPYITDDIMPNLSAILEKHPEIRASITEADGGIYGLPAAEQMGTSAVGDPNDYSIYTIPQFSMINKKWLDTLGMQVPTTLDELHDVLAAFKEQDMSHTVYGNPEGSTIPMSTGFDKWCWGQNIFYAGFGFTNWTNDVCDDLILKPDKTVDFVSTWDEYREAVTYFHTWYAEGLMDPEMFSQDDTQYISKCSKGEVGVATWWYIDELMGDYADDYVFLPVLDGPGGTHNVTVRTGGGTSAGQLSITSACKSPVNLLKFYDKWYEPENVMQLQYGPEGVYFTGKDDNGLWTAITDDEAKEKYGKSAGEMKSSFEVAGPKLILSDYYSTTFRMEDRALERLKDLSGYWMNFVQDTTAYPVDCVFTQDELDTIDIYKTDFQNMSAEYEGLWIKKGGPTDAEWEEYKKILTDNCGMDELKKVYQAAYDRYEKAAGEEK